MSQDYHYSKIVKFHDLTGCPINRYGHLLYPYGPGHKTLKIGEEAMELTSPYGSLHYAVGSQDDFYCFDFHAWDYTVVLHAVINSETGGFIQDAAYDLVCILEDEPEYIALQLTEQALEWCTENNIRHNKSGWNQDPYYFFRCVCVAAKRLGDGMLDCIPEFSERQRRYGGKRINKFCQLDI